MMTLAQAIQETLSEWGGVEVPISSGEQFEENINRLLAKQGDCVRVVPVGESPVESR